MCGRYTHLFTWTQLHRLMELTTPPTQLALRYNVAPTQIAPVVLAAKSERRLKMLRWGLVPSWAKSGAFGARTINARSETVAGAPAFRAAFKQRRCLVPISGFYEWEKRAEGQPKQPWYITPMDDRPLALAGLWEEWGGGEELIRSFTILTTSANTLMSPIHDRMPVILEPDRFGEWLDPGVEASDKLRELLVPCRSERLRAARVGSWVSSGAHQGARCIEPGIVPVGDEAGEGGLFGRT